MIVQVSTATYIAPIILRDFDGVAVTDKVDGNFTVTAILDDTIVSVDATVTHITNGLYSVLATFADTGTGTVLASVVVDGETIEDVQTVQVLTAAQIDPAAALSPFAVDFEGSIGESGIVTIKIGDDYLTADGRELVWTRTGGVEWPDLTDATITLGAKQRPKDSRNITATGTVLVATGDGQSVSIDLPRAQTVGKSPGVWLFDVQAVIESGSTVTLFSGALNLVTDYAS